VTKVQEGGTFTYLCLMKAVSTSDYVVWKQQERWMKEEPTW
jgi:hypothetical protein